MRDDLDVLAEHEEFSPRGPCVCVGQPTTAFAKELDTLRCLQPTAVAAAATATAAAAAAAAAARAVTACLMTPHRHRRQRKAAPSEGHHLSLRATDGLSHHLPQRQRVPDHDRVRHEGRHALGAACALLPLVRLGVVELEVVEVACVSVEESLDRLSSAHDDRQKLPLDVGEAVASHQLFNGQETLNERRW